MQFVFLDMAGQTLFTRDDAETANWTVEQKSLAIDFPYVESKVISTGQRVYFKDPSTGDAQVYEIKTAKTVEPSAYQQITAEHICISELTDDHMERQELTDVACSAALNGVLSGTLWQVGQISINPVSSADLPRGSVWQAVLEIETNWNVYIVPRVSLSSTGSITRYLDIKSTAGEWNGMRLSIDKNLLDPSVTYDDTELATALYGYGGTIHGTDPKKDEDKECTFENVVWTATANHPAKPAGQTYLEDPAATAAYGRDGRARFGFYQNTDITDPELLLEKTWEALKNTSTPAISIEGTVSDLKRLGYADTPLRLHDIALVEVLPAGFKKQLQIIRLSVNLLDPSESVVTIGAYIPNIVYINRDTAVDTSGTLGGNKNKNKAETERKEYEAKLESVEAGTGLRLRAFQNDLDDMDNELKLQEGRITVLYNNIELEVIDRRNADNILAGRITVQANKIALVVEEKNGQNVIKAASIVAAVNDAGSSVLIAADHISISGNTTLSGTLAIDNGRLLVKKTAVFNGDVILNTPNATVTAPKFSVSSGGSLTFVGGGSGERYVLNTSNVPNFITDLSVSLSGNTYTLKRKTVYKSDQYYDFDTPITFSRATTLSGAWDGGIYTVTASPQGNTRSIGFSSSADVVLSVGSNGSASAVSSLRKSATIPVRVINTVGTTQTDVWTGSITSNCAVVWNNGYDDARDLISMPSTIPAGVEQTTFAVLVPNAARTGQDTKTFTLTKGPPSASGGYAAASLSGYVVARIDISNWYWGGWTGYKDSALWAKATSATNWMAQIPNADGTAAEDWDCGAKPTTSEIGVDQLQIKGQYEPISGRTSAGSLSKSNISAPGYLFFRVGCHGTTKNYYITINP